MRRLLPLIVVLLLPVSGHATLLLRWDLDQLVARSDLIVVGTLGSQRSIQSGEHVLTESTINVEQTLLGKPIGMFVLSQLGGQIGTIITDVVGTARLRSGQRVVLITYQHADGRRYLVGMSQGAFTLSGSRLVQRIDVPRVLPSGQLSPASGVQTQYVDTLVDAIARRNR